MKSGFIYFLRAIGTDLVKIGFATDVQRRIACLQTGCPHQLKLIHCVNGDRSYEAAIHRQFAALRHCREWFRYSPAMLRVTGMQTGGLSIWFWIVLVVVAALVLRGIG